MAPAMPVTSQVRELDRLPVARGHGEIDTTGIFALHDDRPV
jgi:hypothetical protein